MRGLRYHAQRLPPTLAALGIALWHAIAVRILPTIVAALAASAALLLFALPAQFRPSHFLPDDSYFYLQIAHNVASGKGSTFHEITPTNGYHPLWLGICVVADLLAGRDKGALPRAVFAVQALLTVGIGWLFTKISTRLSPGKPWIALSILATYFLTGMYGSEAHVSGFCVAAGIYLLLIARENPARVAGWIRLGLALGLAFLARLDNVFVIGALLALPLLEAACEGPGPLLRRASAVGIPMAALAIPYLAANFLTFGHLVPISGAIKSSLPEVSFRISNLGYLGAGVCLAAVLSLGLSLARGRPLPARPLFAALGAGVLAHALYIVCLTDPGIPWSWYWVPGVLNLCLLSVALCDRLPQRFGSVSRGRLIAGAAIIVALLGVTRGWLRFRDAEAAGINRFTVRQSVSRDRWQRVLGLWMRDHLPPGSGVLVCDQPGALAYYSDLRILPVDGLVNDFRYNEEIVTLGIGDYLRRHRVGYYLGPIVEGRALPQEVAIRAPLNGATAGVLLLGPESLVARLSEISATGPAWALWRLPRSGPS